MKSIQINIPEGFEVDKFDTKTGEITFKEKPKCIMQRIKTIEDVLKYHNIEKDDFEADYKGLPEDVKAYRLLVLIASALNEGWTPDWNNSNEYKYQVYFTMGSSGFRYHDYAYWSADSLVGSRLCFKKLESAKHLATIINDVFEKFMIIK